MSQGSLRFTLVLGAPTPNEPPWPGLVGHAGWPSEADLVLSEAPPDVLVYDPGVAWQRALADRARSLGTPVVAFGASAPGRCDEWVPRECTEPGELKARLDLAYRRARERQCLARRGATDALTGLFNRRALLRAGAQLAGRAQRLGQPLALVLVDLDGFKHVNDRRGHPEGDRLLKQVGSVLRREVRQGEVCGRVGGDEFALVLVGGPREAARAKDRVLGALRSAGVSASAGVAVSPARGARRLYHRADEALLEAKRLRSLLAASPPNPPRPAQETTP